MNLTIVTILADGTHLDHWEEVESDKIEHVSDGPLARHIADRLATYPECLIDRFIVVAGSLSWKIEIRRGQHLPYAPALQLVAKGRA